MAVNDFHFVPPQQQHTYLAARGFDAKGARSGGIRTPRIVDIPSGSVLFRFFHEPRGTYGQWWATPRELSIIVAYFGLGVGAFDTGRTAGKGILQGTLAVRHDWAGNDPLHMGEFIVVRLTAAFKAYFGEGDHAPDATQKQNQKVLMIFDDHGRQRGATQVFLPRAWDYQANMTKIGGGIGEKLLLDAIALHAHQKLAFE